MISLKAKESSLICSDLKIVHLMISRQVWFTNTYVVDAVPPIMVRTAVLKS